MTDPEHAPRHRELPPVVRAAIALAVVLTVGLLLIQADRARRGVPVTEAEVHGGGVPQRAPAFSLPDRQGLQHTLEEVSGKPVLLNFWATWCPPCLDEMPALQRMIEALADTDLVVVAVSLDESWDAVDPVLQQLGFGEGALILLDPDRAVAQSFGTFKVPETYLIDREGRIVHRYQGAKAWDQGQFLKDLRAFVDGKFGKGDAH